MLLTHIVVGSLNMIKAQCDSRLRLAFLRKALKISSFQLFDFELENDVFLVYSSENRKVVGN